jgi:hypothetical protein
LPKYSLTCVVSGNNEKIWETETPKIYIGAKIKKKEQVYKLPSMTA